ncbi:MAG: lipopolysaccharide biosynthesis protein [Alsobacter sp.]
MQMMTSGYRMLAGGAPPSTSVLQRLARRKGTFAFVFLAVMGLVAAALALLPKSYVATGSIIVADQEPVGATASAAWLQKVGDPADIESQLLLIRSSRVLRLALARPAAAAAIREECALQDESTLSRLLGRGSTCQKLESSGDALVDYAQQRYTVRSVGRSRVISVSYQSPSPEVARTMTNELVSAFLEDQRRISSKGRELARLAQLLSTAETAEAQAYAKVQEVTAGGGQGGSAKATQDSRAVGDIKQQLATVSAEYANLSQTLGPNHPSVRAFRQQRDELAARVNSEVGGIVAGARQAYQAAVGVTTSIRDRIEAVEKGAAIEEPAQVAADDRTLLLGSTRLVSFAELPPTPTFPKTIPFLAAGLSLGLVLGLGAAVLRDLADRRVRSPAELAAATGVPVPAVLPRIGRGLGGFAPFRRGGRRGSLFAALRQARRSKPYREGLRRLQAHLHLIGFGTHRRTLLVTSARPGEGKTLTLLGLAELFAAGGRRVLVIDGDLHRPSIAAALGVDPKDGLAAVLQGQALPRDAVVPTEDANIDLLAVSRGSKMATEFLMGSRLAAMLDWDGRYDIVLVDSPAESAAVDAQLFARHVSGVLCCLEWGAATTAEAADCVDALQAAGGTVVALAVTKAERRAARFYGARTPAPRAVPVTL